MSLLPLQKELELFESRRAEFLQRAEGKFVVIHGDEVLGFYDTEMNAYEAGATEYGNEPFLIKEVCPEDPVFDVPAFTTGILYAAL